MREIDWSSIFKDIGKYNRSLEDTRLFFMNRPLRPYVDSLWFEAGKIVDLRVYLPTNTKRLNDNISLLEEIRSLMQITVEAASGKIEGAHFTLRESKHLQQFRADSEAMLRDRLTNLSIVEDLWLSWFPVVPDQLVKKWTEECWDKIPYLEDIAVNKDGHFSIQSLRQHIKALESAIEKTRAISLYKEEDLLLHFLLHAKRIGVPLNNKFYRDLYDFMEYLDLIPAHILKSHRANTQKYVRENYIKSLYRHNPWMNNYPPLPNETADDWDRELEEEKKKESK